MAVQHIHSILELDNLLTKSSPDHLIVIDFYADWCPPCRFIAPIFETFPQRYSNASFLKVNVDQSRDISGRYNVRAMPTFVFIKNGQEVDRVQGADQNGIQNTIERHHTLKVASKPSVVPNENENAYMRKLSEMSRMAKVYADPVYKLLAISVLPEDVRKNVNDFNIGQFDQIAMIMKLLEWFKNDFFAWCDTPKCEKCGELAGKDTTKTGLGNPTESELKFGAQRVEVYECRNCKIEVRFPRFNNPAKLLETRKGRCGEWANCFALVASAAGNQVRLIYDSADHVWTEVYINSAKRWVHCDPCEQSLDRPLLYEKGWNKQLAYVVGFGVDHVHDVTWRYVMNSRVANSRRWVRNEVFQLGMQKMNNRQMDGLPDGRKTILKLQRFTEIFEMLLEEGLKKKICKDSEFGGRISGNEEWKRARGENGEIESRNHVIQIGNEEKNFELSYNPSSDEYIDINGKKTNGFREMAFETKNLQRKVEKDWKKAYICRENGDEEGQMIWHFDLTGQKVKKIEILAKGCEKFADTANVIVVACYGESCMRVSPKTGKLVIEEGGEGGLLKITATLSGGEGDSAFQHAQLFRTDLSENGGNDSENPFTVKICLE